MIQHKTARQLLYSWHNGQSDPIYAAASSGLVQDWDALLYSIEHGVDDETDRNKLSEYIKHKQRKAKHYYVIRGLRYYPLPWVSRSYGQLVEG